MGTYPPQAILQNFLPYILRDLPCHTIAVLLTFFTAFLT